MRQLTAESESLQRLRSAALALIGPGQVKQRLCDACLRHLQGLEPNELPRDLAVSYRELMTMLRSAPAIGGMGPVEATVRKMSDQDAAACAARILDLYVALSGALPVLAVRELPGSPRQLRLVGDD